MVAKWHWTPRALRKNEELFPLVSYTSVSDLPQRQYLRNVLILYISPVNTTLTALFPENNPSQHPS